MKEVLCNDLVIKLKNDDEKVLKKFSFVNEGTKLDNCDVLKSVLIITNSMVYYSSWGFDNLKNGLKKVKTLDTYATIGALKIRYMKKLGKCTFIFNMGSIKTYVNFIIDDKIEEFIKEYNILLKKQ